MTAGGGRLSLKIGMAAAAFLALGSAAAAFAQDRRAAENAGPPTHTAATATQPDKVTVAVLEFSEKSDDAFALQLADTLAGRLGAKPGVVVTDRQAVRRIMQEQRIDAALSSSDRKAFGRAVGARWLVYGRIYQAGEKRFVNATVLETETGLLRQATASGAKDADPDALADQLADSVASCLRATPGTPALADAALARIKGSLAGRRLPAVAVVIAESHRSLRDDRVTEDPDRVAEAEMKRLLRGCGFTVVDVPDQARRTLAGPPTGWGRANGEAQWVLTGTATSRFIQRQGEVVVCAGDIELELIRAAAGKVAAKAAGAGQGTDLKEALAGQSARADAGRAVAPELLARLAAALPDGQASPAGKPAAPAAAATQPARLHRTLFVVRFDNATGQDQYDPAAVGVADLLAGLLAQQPAIRVVERQRLLGLTAEQALGLAGLTGQPYAAAAGKLLQADTAVVGRLFLVEGKMTISAKAIELAGERVIGSDQVTGRPEDLPELALQLARRLGEQMSLPLPPVELDKLDRSPVASLHFGKALSHYYAGDMQSALMQFMRTIDLDPDYVDVHYFAGKCYLAVNEPAHAVLEWDKLLKRNPANPYAGEVRKLLPQAREAAAASTVRPLVPQDLLKSKPAAGGAGPSTRPADPGQEH